MADETRQSPRIPAQNLKAELQLGGTKIQAEILDVSEGGAQMLLPPGADATASDTITVFLASLPEIKATIRRVADSPSAAGRKVIGIQFAALIDVSIVIG